MSRNELDTTADAPGALREGSERPKPEDATKREGSERPPKAATQDPEVSAPKPVYLSRGALVGRYVVLDIIGEGGMGVVYSAFDPDLDRRVAIKLLQASSNDESTGQQWLLREAQALARLSHPNVVSVHDVGTLANDRVFVAMELVDGDTLRKWLRKERTWREVVDVMLAAGRGLAAAHSAGLVHRDFKPENVLIGTDGRTRVMDFGLARLRPGEQPPASRDSDLKIEARSPLSERLTVAGTVVGTPAYMAPEIYTGGTADARADQFAFGVALYESLFLMRPYERRDLQEGVAMRPKQPNDDKKVPAQIKRVVMRALSISVDERYPSMDALLAELEIDPTVRRKRVVLGAGATAVVVGVIAVTSTIQGSRAAESTELCSGADRRLAGAWDAATKQRVRDAFVASKSPVATKSFDALSRALDAYGAEWTRSSTESCEATRIRGEQTEDVMSLRQSCLDQRLEEMRALIRVLGDEPTTTLVEQGERPALSLEPLARCGNVAALLEPGRPAPELAPKVFEVTKALAEAKALIIAGRYVPALIAATKAADVARALAWKPSIAEAQGIRGSALQASGRFVEAAAAYADATWAALEGKRDDLVAGGAFSSAMCVASGLGKPGEAKVWLALADSAARRSGSLDPQMALRRTQVRGIVFAESGDLVAAVAAHEQTFKTAVQLYGKESPGLFADEVMYATTLVKAFRFTTSIPHFEHAIALRSAIVGKEHADIAMMLSNAGISYRRSRDYVRAHDALGRALAIREKAYGKNSPLLVATLDNLADLYEQERDFPRAFETIERAQRLAEILPGKDHPNWHQIATDHAEIMLAAGKLKDARLLFDEILAGELKTQSVVLPITQTSRAELALAERAWDEAARFATQALAGFEAAGGPNHPELVRTLSALGRAQLALGKRAEAKKSLERALVIAKTTELHDDDLAVTRDALRNLN